MRRSLSALATALLGLGAVVGSTAGASPAAMGLARVVVAIPDEPTNPYHEVFHTGPSVVTQAVLDEFGVDDDHIIRITRTGDYEADYEADAAQYDRVERGELYWFEGTNLFAVSFQPGLVPLLADHEDESHGVGTTSAVVRANPEAIVIAVEGQNAAAEQWAFTTPYVDIVSTSYGPIGSPPLGGHLEASYEGVVQLGKLHVGAADNTPALSPFDSNSGPWWSIAVAGMHEDEGRSREGVSGNLIDFVSDFSQELPICGNCESGTDFVAGTSFATPRIAGTISRVLLEARRRAGHRGGIVTAGVDAPTMVLGEGWSLTNWDLRRVMEEAAWYPETAQDSRMDGLGTYGVPPEAPYVAIGWGLVSPDPRFDVVGQAEAHLDLVDRDPTRFKSAAACAYMTGQMQFRRLYWDRVEPSSDSSGQSADGYVAC